MSNQNRARTALATLLSATVSMLIVATGQVAVAQDYGDLPEDCQRTSRVRMELGDRYYDDQWVAGYRRSLNDRVLSAGDRADVDDMLKILSDPAVSGYGYRIQCFPDRYRLTRFMMTVQGFRYNDEAIVLQLREEYAQRSSPDQRVPSSTHEPSIDEDTLRRRILNIPTGKGWERINRNGNVYQYRQFNRQAVTGPRGGGTRRVERVLEMQLQFGVMNVTQWYYINGVATDIDHWSFDW